jgi:hypothetical protein
LIGIFISVSCCAQAQCNHHAQMDAMERASFVAAEQGSREEISVEVLAEEGCIQAVLDGLHALGAKDRFVDNKVGYAWAMMPKDKVSDVSDLGGVSEAWASTRPLDYFLWEAPTAGPHPVAPVPSFTIPILRVADQLPANGPFFPAKEAGLTDLWAQHPEADGRGVKVALFDDGLDLLHPALQNALSEKGEVLPKVADILPVTGTNEAMGWVQFGGSFSTTDGRFQEAGRTWVAPHNGTFRFGIFSAELYFSAWIPGFSTTKPPADVPLSVAVLWDESANRVWVDTNGDGSFLDQRALGDYGETHDLDYFGNKTAEGDNRLPFGVKIDRNQKAAFFSLSRGFHGAAVAGTLAANRETGGLYEGAAPNAQLIDVRGSSANGKFAAMIAALARNDVDILNRSGILNHSAPGGGYESDFDRHILDRATAAYDKPVSCLCMSTNALRIRDYQSPEMLRRNRQTRGPYLEAANGMVRADSDGLVNEILAPSNMLAAQSRYNPLFETRKDGRTLLTDGEEDTVPGVAVPAGYWIGMNNSPTIPYGAGVLADLIAEARRQHVRYNAQRLVDAVLLSGKRIPRLPIAIQAHGVINAAGAWEQLQRMSKADDPSNAELTSFIVEQGEPPAQQKIQGFWADFPERGGPHVVRLWVTRRGGYAGQRSYQLSLKGNDGTFRLPITK